MVSREPWRSSAVPCQDLGKRGRSVKRLAARRDGPTPAYFYGP
jgi:hypothetical protein